MSEGTEGRDGAVAVVEANALQEFASKHGQAKMIALANEFKDVSEQRQASGRPWIVSIGPGRHLTIEAWQYLGQRAGVMVATLAVDESRNPVTGDFEGARATAEAIRIDTGQVIGRAIQVCYADEVVKKKNGQLHKRWLDEEGKPSRHAIVGMAQTRAHSRAYAGALRFLAEFAGMDGTPAEEMHGVEPGEKREPVKQPQARKPAPAEDATVRDVAGEVLEVESKHGNTNGKDWTKYGVKIGSQWFGTFDAELAAIAVVGATVVGTYTKRGQYNNLATLRAGEEGDKFDL